jgi:NADH-quinone oxidoreductase subunit L
VIVGIGLGWMLYGNKPTSAGEPDVLERAVPLVWKALSDRLYVDELYGATVIAFYGWWGQVADWLDRRVWGGVVSAVAWMTRMGAELNRFLDANVVNGAFDKGCEEISTGGGLLSQMQNGRVQSYLRILALAIVALVAILIWSRA